jgi:hypothetical protein
LFSAALGAGAAIVPTVASAATNTFVNAKINGDDQFKVHLSTLPTESGFQYVNGYGWSVTYTSPPIYLPLCSRDWFPRAWASTAADLHLGA